MSTTEAKVRLEDHDPDIGLKPHTTKSELVEFLYANDEYGYQPKAVHEELDVPHNTVKSTLRRLKNQNYIAQTIDGYYHARPDRKDLYRYVGAVGGLDRMFEKYNETAGNGNTTESSDSQSDSGSSLTDNEIEDAIDVFDDEE